MGVWEKCEDAQQATELRKEASEERGQRAGVETLQCDAVGISALLLHGKLSSDLPDLQLQ